MYDTTKPYTERIVNLIKDTWQLSDFINVIEGSDNVPYLTGHDFYEVDHTDGVGTKGVFHWELRTFKELVQDALAMNMNDLLIFGVRPFKLQNHLILPKDDDKAIYEVMYHLCDFCKKNKIIVTGGETSIQNNLIGMDLSITMSGAASSIRKNEFLPGHILLGLKSSGIHSNGFTRIRQLFGSGIDFVTPTEIYFDKLWNIIPLISGMCNITGGAFTRLKKYNVSMHIIHSATNLKYEIFNKIYERQCKAQIYLGCKGTPDEEMYKTFNCGIGFVLSVLDRNVKDVMNELQKNGQEAEIIGAVDEGDSKITIDSVFSNQLVIL